MPYSPREDGLKRYNPQNETLDSATSRRQARIRQWMIDTISNGGIDRLDDLHVDKVDESWRERPTWVTAGLTAYQLAVRVREELALDVTVALAFSLVESSGDRTTILQTRRDIEDQLDWSPPSLYLFKRGDRKHLSGTAQIDPLPETLVSEFANDAQAFLLRWTDENGNQMRSILVQA